LWIIKSNWVVISLPSSPIEIAVIPVSPTPLNSANPVAESILTRLVSKLFHIAE